MVEPASSLSRQYQRPPWPLITQERTPHIFKHCRNQVGSIHYPLNNVWILCSCVSQPHSPLLVARGMPFSSIHTEPIIATLETQNDIMYWKALLKGMGFFMFFVRKTISSYSRLFYLLICLWDAIGLHPCCRHDISEATDTVTFWMLRTQLMKLMTSEIMCVWMWKSLQ